MDSLLIESRRGAQSATGKVGFPVQRPRRLRQNDTLRRMVRETDLTADDLIHPLFIRPGSGVKQPISSMPGQYQLSPDMAVRECWELASAGIRSIILFGIPSVKDAVGSEAYDEHGIIQVAIREIKRSLPDLLVITDVCLCEYTDHGHCGVLQTPDKMHEHPGFPEGYVLNDPTLELLGRMALSHVEAGADVVAPSDMMDGRVGAIREMLDTNGFIGVPIMAYSAKYASAFYGPFRDAAESPPQFGDRKAYQMDPPNAREAIREVELDLIEGADVVMVKPALPYLDIIRMVRDRFDVPIAAYNVSGEYAMVKAAAMNGWIDERKVALELLTGIRRAGADVIITYHAKDAAGWLAEDRR